MDAQKCLEILCSRADCTNHALCIACETTTTSTENATVRADEGNETTSANEGTYSGSYTDMSPVDLVTLFTTLQAERVQSYRDFRIALDVLIEEIRIAEYASLCGEMTARFSVISNKIIALEAHMRKIGLVEVADLIKKV